MLKISNKLWPKSLNIKNHFAYLNINRVKSTGIVRDKSKLIKPNYNKLSYAIADTTNLSLLSDTLPDRVKTLAEEKPNNVCYKFSLTQTQFTFLEVKQRIDEIAQNFLDMGFQKGDRIAILLPNIPENNLVMLAASSIGLIVVLMNPAYRLVEVEYMLKKTQAKGVVIMDNLKILQHYDIIKTICPEIENSSKGELNSKNLPHLKHVIMVNNRLFKDPNQQTKGTWQFNELEKFNKQPREKPHVDMDDSFVIMFTVNIKNLNFNLI